MQFLPGGQTAAAEKGTTLLQAAFKAGVTVESPCGGKGSCGKCQMEIQIGTVTGKCLACQTKIDSDMEVLTAGMPEEQILTAKSVQAIQTDTGIRVCHLDIPPIIPGEADSIWERVHSALQEVGADSDIAVVDITLLDKLYQTIREGEQQVYAVLYQKEVLDICSQKPRPLIFAVDIGTTTLAGYLMDAETGAELTQVSAKNPQSRFGADVISRADHVLANGGEEMTACIRSAVSDLLAAAADKAKVAVNSIYLTVLVGNTCMHHLFLGISPESLVHAPYSPVIRQGLKLRANEYLKCAPPGGLLKFLPNIAGFVGADTSACLIACNFEQEEKLTLLMDIGTNGELVLGNRHKAAACSTAAGPAFEGAKIKCGMRGTVGAIEHVKMEAGELFLSVIGDTAPTGICGSGLLDIMALMVEHGFVDSLGMLYSQDELVSREAQRNKERLQGSGMERRLVLYQDQDTGKSVYITQKDIGELQLAKAAMAAGIQILCQKLGIRTADIEQVLIAGAFGNYLSPDSACRIGLIPDILRDKIKAIGNAAGAGAVQAALNLERWRTAQKLAAGIEFTELAAEQDFSDIFVGELEFQV